MNRLFAFDDAACQRLAEEHGTPLFAYSAERVREAYLLLRAALPPRARIAYAVKANPHPELLACLAELGASFDCASIGELDRVAATGVEGQRVFFAGPGKRAPELARAVELSARVQAEGIEDLERLDALATGPLAVNLRVHPASGVTEANRIIGGAGPSVFGVDEEHLEEAVAFAKRLRHVRIRGLHVFASSNQRDAHVLLANHARVFELAGRLTELVGEPLEQIDVGGGLGIPYADDQEPLDVVALGRGLSELLARAPWFTGELLLEPGRYLAGPCGVYLARVVRVKESRGTLFAILEGGINHLLRPQLTGEPFPARALAATARTPLLPTTLAGPLCTSLDRLGTVPLPPLTPGTLIALGQTGAYGLTEGMTHFLSHPQPPEVWSD